MIGVDEPVVVVGGGVGGLSAAVALRGLGHTGPLVVLDSGDRLHDRPPLSKAYLRGDVTEEGLSPYPADHLADLDVQVRTGATAVGLDPGGSGGPVGPGTPRDPGSPGDPAGGAVVSLADGTRHRAAAVVLAEGGRATRLQVPGGGLASVLRTLDDARSLRARLLPGARLVVLGGGLVGAEVAATAVAMGMDVTVVDPDPLPVAAALGADVARVLVEDHARHGVRLVTAGATGLARTGGGERPGPVRVSLSDGSAVEADVVLVATGMRPVDDLARAAGIEVAPDGGTLVDEHQRTSAARVLAVGDGTRRRGSVGRPARPAGHWDAARLDGQAAAAVLLGQDPPARGAPWFWSDRHGRHVEAVGDVTAGTRTVHRGAPGPAPFTVMGWRDGVLTGAVAVDDALAARAARRLLDRGVRVDPDVLADPATDLRRLLRG